METLISTAGARLAVEISETVGLSILSRPHVSVLNTRAYVLDEGAASSSPLMSYNVEVQEKHCCIFLVGTKKDKLKSRYVSKISQFSNTTEPQPHAVVCVGHTQSSGHQLNLNLKRSLVIFACLNSKQLC